MAQRPFGALEQLARVGLGKRHAQVLARGLPEALAHWLDQLRVVDVGVTRKRFEMADQPDQVLVCNGGFEAEVVFDGDGEGLDEVQGGSTGQSVIEYLSTYVCKTRKACTVCREGRPWQTRPRVRGRVAK